MALTAQQISQLPVSAVIGNQIPQGAYEIIAKSPLLLAELQSYSAEITNGTRAPIGFLPKNADGTLGGSQRSSPAQRLPLIEIGNQFLTGESAA